MLPIRILDRSRRVLQPIDDCLAALDGPRSRRSRCVLTTSCLARLRAVSHDEAFRSGNGHNDPMVQSLALVLEHEVIGRQLLTCLERSSTDINRSMRFA